MKHLRILAITFIAAFLFIGEAALTTTTAATTFNVTDAASLIQAIENANDETNYPGVDIIDLGDNTIIFSSSYADYDGATALPHITSEMTIQNGTLDGNSRSGFRLLNITETGTLTLTQITLQNSGGASYTGTGGALYNQGNLVINRSILRGNQSNYRGGAITNQGVATIKQSLISGNRASQYGGAIETYGSMTILNSTIVGNAAGTDGGSIRNSDTIDIDNSILWGNSSSFLDAGYFPDSWFTFSLVQGSVNGSDNRVADPRFVAPRYFTEAPTILGDYQLSQLSATIDSASNTNAADAGIAAIDLNGNPRYKDDSGITDKGEGTAPIIDIGAYEFQGTTTVCDAYSFPYTVTGDIGDLQTAIACANVNETEDIIDLNGNTFMPTTAYTNYNGMTILPPVYTRLTLQNGTLNAENSGSRLLYVTPTGRLSLNAIDLLNSGSPTYEAGGALYNAGVTILRRSRIAGSEVSGAGAAIYNSGYLTLLNSLVTGNKAPLFGGAIYNEETMTVVNSTFAGNASTALRNFTGSVYNEPSPTAGTMEMYNSIVWGNENGITGYDRLTIQHSTSGFVDDGNLIAMPHFVDPRPYTDAPTTAGDYRVASTSPTIDAGSNTLAANASLTATDLAGDSRYVDDTGMIDRGTGTAPIIDMGAYEFQHTTDCTMYSSPYFVTAGVADLQMAIACANAAATASIIDLNGATFNLSPTPSNYRPSAALDEILNDITIRNGTLDAANSNLRFFLVEDEAHLTLENMTLQNIGDDEFNAFDDGTGVYVRGKLTVRDSTFTGHSSTRGSTIYTAYTENAVNVINSVFRANDAMSIYNLRSEVTVTGSTFEDNQASNGSGIHNRDGMLTVNNSTFKNSSIYSLTSAYPSNPQGVMITNSTFLDGSHIDNRGNRGETVAIIQGSTFSGMTPERNIGFVGNSSRMVITDSLFTNNDTGSSTVVANANGDMLINRSTFTDNSTTDDGGAIQNRGDMTILNSLFAGNRAEAGSAIYNQNYAKLDIINSTFADNQASGAPGAIYTSGGTTIANSIIWGNNAAFPSAESGAASVTYSIVQGNDAGTGNLSVDPRFVDATNGNYALQSDSPAIDAASNIAARNADISATDLAGNPRFVDDICVPDAGEGTRPIIDMGAYEAASLVVEVDVNQDGIVSPTDAIYVINRLDNDDCTADVDGDSDVDSDDLNAVYDVLGTTP